MANVMGKRVNQMWDYFIKTGERAKCLLCNKVLKISQRSSTGLKYHLKSIHQIDLASAQKSIPQGGPSISRDDSIDTVNIRYDDEEHKNKIAKKSSLDGYFNKEHSKEFMISRMVAKDGISFISLSTSEDLKYLFLKNGFSLPSSPRAIKSIVEHFSSTVQDEIRKQVEKFKKRGEKFSLTVYECTSVNDKSYLNINVHNIGAYFNLGLIRLQNSCNAEDCINLIKIRLGKFLIHLDSDIIGITTGGANIMKKVGRLLNCYHQLCFAHGIHLAVVDVLYKNTHSKKFELKFSENIKSIAVYNSDSDNDNGSCDDETSVEPLSSSCLQSEHQPVELILKYKDLIKKVRKVVKMLRKSQSEDYLQKYVQQDLGKKKYSIILDCKTSWSSLFNMLERFNALKDCITKALIDLESDINFTDEEWSDIKELLLCLHPVKLAVEVLCRRDSTLLTADTTLRFILDKLDKQQSRLSRDLATVLRERIKERRNDLSGIILYLHNFKKYENFITNSDDIFLVPKKSNVRLEIENICERMLFFGENVDHEPIIHEEIIKEEITTNSSLSLNEELEIQLMKEKTDTRSTGMSTNKQNLKKIIKAEMAEFENSGNKGKYLSLVYNYLNTITPTSIEASNAFSVSSSIIVPIRNKMADKTLDTVCFLRSFFENNHI